MIGVQEGDVNAISKEATLTYKALGQYGEHEFGGQEIQTAGEHHRLRKRSRGNRSVLRLECAETEHPAHVIRGVFCGEFVVGILGEECTPPTYAGLNRCSMKLEIGSPDSPFDPDQGQRWSRRPR